MGADRERMDEIGIQIRSVFLVSRYRTALKYLFCIQIPIIRAHPRPSAVRFPWQHPHILRKTQFLIPKYSIEPLAKLLCVFGMIPLSGTGSINSFKNTKMEPACNAMFACASKRSIAGRLACPHTGVILQEALFISVLRPKRPSPPFSYP